MNNRFSKQGSYLPALIREYGEKEAIRKLRLAEGLFGSSFTNKNKKLEALKISSLPIANSIPKPKHRIKCTDLEAIWNN